MMKKITLFLFVLTAYFGYSQSIPVNFDSDITIGAKNVTVTPADANWFSDSGLTSTAVFDLPSDTPDHGNAGQIISSSSGQPWQNAQLLMTTNYIDLTSNKTITVDVYSEAAQNFLLKLEQSKDGITGNTEKSFSHTGSGWETIAVDFTTPNAGPVPNDQYKLIVFFPCYSAGFANPPFDSTTYIDNVTATVGDAIVATPAPTDAPTIPNNPGNVFNIYSTAGDGSNLVTPGYNGNAFNGGTTATPIVFSGNEVTKYGSVNYVGAQWTAVNFTTLPGPPTHIHLDYWATGITQMKFFLIDQGIGESPYDLVADGGGIVSETWTGIDIPLSAFTTPLTNVFQWKLDALAGTAGDFYLDNIYLTDQPGLGTKDFQIAGLNLYPNPTKDSWTVKTKNVNISSVQVYDILGKNVLSLSPNASEVKIDATKLSKGLYFATVKTEAGSESLKLIKN